MKGLVVISEELGLYGTPETRVFFEDWVRSTKQDLVNYLEQNRTAELDEIATHLRISRDSVRFFMDKLAKENKIAPIGT